MMGILSSGSWPGGDPPAWDAGRGAPVAHRAQMQAAARRPAKARVPQRGRRRGAGAATPRPAGTSRKRRKRGAGAS